MSFMLCRVCNPLCANRSLAEDWAGGHVCFSSLDTTGSLRIWGLAKLSCSDFLGAVGSLPGETPTEKC